MSHDATNSDGKNVFKFSFVLTQAFFFTLAVELCDFTEDKDEKFAVEMYLLMIQE